MLDVERQVVFNKTSDETQSYVNQGLDKDVDYLYSILKSKDNALIPVISAIPAHYSQDGAWGIGTSRTKIASPLAFSINIGGKGFIMPSQVELDCNVASNWDTTTPTDYSQANNRAGITFYVYACQNPSGTTPILKLSANANNPSSYTTADSRKVAWFSCLSADYGIVTGDPLSGYLKGDIDPRTIRDISIPKNNPAGNIKSTNVQNAINELDARGLMEGMKNKIINGDFSVWQRGGTSAYNNNDGITADRWIVGAVQGSGAVTAGSNKFSSVSKSRYYLNWQHNTSANCEVAYLTQRIENARREGKFTLQVKARCNSGNAKFHVRASQVFGTGGTPSPSVDLDNLGSFEFTNEVTTESITFTLPSIDGKNFGSNNNDYIQINLLSDFPTLAHNLDIFEIQLEEGEIASAFEDRHVSIEERLCMRYRQIISCSGYVHSVGAIYHGSPVMYPAPLRAIPTVSMIYPGDDIANLNDAYLDAQTAISARFVMVITTAGPSSITNRQFLIDAEL